MSLLIVIYFLIVKFTIKTLEKLVDKFLDYLPNPKTEKQEKKEENYENIKKFQPIWEKLGLNVRGGGVLLPTLNQIELSSSVDPIFLIIHVEKLKLQLTALEKRLQTKKMQPKKRVILKERALRKVSQTQKILKKGSDNIQIIAYCILALLTIGSRLRNPTDIRHSSQIRAQPQETAKPFEQVKKLYSMEEMEEMQQSHRKIQIQVGDTIFVAKREEVSNSKVRETTHRARPVRCKVARFSDLPRLPDEMFGDEIVTQKSQSSFDRIRVKN